jgi:GH24 family phage-related lysozyme (muramidase)
VLKLSQGTVLTSFITYNLSTQLLFPSTHSANANANT